MATKRLSEISTRISSGLTPLRSNPEFWKNGTIPWLKTEQLGEKYIYDTNEYISVAAVEKTSIKVFPRNTLSIAMYGEGKTRGNLSIIKKPMATNQACCNVEIDSDKADYEYIYYFLKTQYEELRNLSSGVRKNLNSNDIKNYPIRLPKTKDEQTKIASVLKSLDAKIELNNRINAELEAMAKTLYDYWFVQFDFPFDFAQGKSDANGKPYKTSGGKMVYNPALKRKIPEGWEVTKIGKIAKTVLGGTPDTGVDEYWKNADIPWLSSAEIASFPVITSEQKTTQKGIENSAATILPKGTVVISIVRYIRSSILGIDAATNQSVVGIKECSRLKSSFIYPYFCGEVPRLMGLRTGAQQPHINKGVIEDSSIALPPDDILESYYEITTPIYEQVMNLAFQNYELIKLRDWLLPMLMNGQVTVKQ
ncbi:restriction endonuclease subunit S [Nitrosomonas sp. Nm33]|uniref:restriction endonuclease subunit S n=1 Tax=Nitrosomonas sp. Nm33 TaxID=133724 RepID=UPI000899AC29|nr:restriction endonuclease subunit S [Nitrosomonas sp. Nm33]SDX98752.1 type I restriction enzyme, S subunit [Nitrosomonas sp. Nm33]